VALAGRPAAAQPPTPIPPAAAAPPSEPAAPPDPAAGDPAAPPASATEALTRARDAYEFGDLQQMVELSRQVAEGAVPGSEDQRAEALRLFGIGLYLDGRRDGAERAFIDLLKLRPNATLDPRITRPEVVAFFREVRRRNRPKKHKALVFLPPLGQFQNDTPGRGWLIAGLQVATAGTALASFFMYRDRVNNQGLCTGTPDFEAKPCERLKAINLISGVAFLAVYAAGVVDGLMGFEEGDPEEPRLSLAVFPTGAALRLRF
jgi:hypothetical protein